MAESKSRSIKTDLKNEILRQLFEKLTLFLCSFIWKFPLNFVFLSAI